MSGRSFKIHPSVISVVAKNKVLKDKTAVYSEENFPEGQVNDLIKGGFLVEVFDTKSAVSKEKKK